MTHEIRFDKNIPCLIMCASGEVGLEEHISGLTDLLNHPEWIPGMKVLHDLQNVTSLNMNSKETQIFAAIVSDNRERIGRGRAAYVLSKTVDFGLARMFEIYCEGKVDFESKSFYNIDEAKQWLTSK